MESVGSTFGQFLIGYLISLSLFGLNGAQTTQYLRTFPDDPWQLKSYVILIWTLELGHSILTGYGVYVTFVNDLPQGDKKSALAHMLLEGSMSGVIAIVIAMLVQWYYAFRLYRLSNFHTLPIVSAMVSLAHSVCYLAASINRLLERPMTREWRWCLSFVGILSITFDFMIVSGLIHGLWKRRDAVAKFGWWPRVVDQVIIIAIQANVVTCISVAITLAIYMTSPNLSWMGLSLISCRLFALSFVSSVLSTKRVRENELDWGNIDNIELRMPPCNYDPTLSDTDGRAASTSTQRHSTLSLPVDTQTPV